MSMSSSSSSSLGDETPRMTEFNDHDFFDSDNDDKKAVIKPKYGVEKSPHDDELHGQGVKDRTSVDGKKIPEFSSDSAEEIVKTKIYKSKLEVTRKEVTDTKSTSLGDNKEHVTIHIPHEGSFLGSDDDSSSVTDVSPLQSPDATPRPRSALRRKKPESSKREDKKESKTKFVIKETTSQNEERPHARRSNGEALSVEDLLYSSDGTPVSSSERDLVGDRKKKVQRRKKNHYDEMQHRMEASTRHHRRRLLDVAAQNSMDISQLLEVVLEMEQENKVRRMLSGSRAARNVSPSPIKPTRRKNMSFSNDQARNIDVENQRLLRRLTQLCSSPQQRPSSASSVRSAASSCRSVASTSRSSRRPATASGMRPSTSQGARVYHSGTNRLRDQQRIERENMAFLKRLQAAKPSTSLRRDNLLKDYERQTGKMVEPVRPRRQKTGYSRRDQRTGGKPDWQDSW